MQIHLVVGEPIVNIVNNNLYKSENVQITGDQKYNLKNLWYLNPEFEEGTFTLSKKSSLKGKGTDQLNLGIISNN